MAPDVLGLYFIALIVVFLLKILSDAGVDLAFVKLYTEHKQNNTIGLIKSAFVFRAGACVLVSLVYFMAESAKLISFLSALSSVTMLVLLLFWMHSFRELLLRLLQAEQRFTTYATALVLAAVAKVFLMLALAFTDQPSINNLLLVEITAFSVSICFAVVQMRNLLSHALKGRMSGGFRLLTFGYPLYLNALLNLGNERVAQYIVATLGGPAVMAFYGIAERLAEAGARLFESFSNVYFPAQSRLFGAADHQAAIRTATLSLIWVNFVLLLVLIGFFLVREVIVVLLFTANYLAVADASALFFGVLLFKSNQTLMGYFAVAAGLKFLPVRVSLVTSVLNVVLCLIAFQKYGYEGAVLALVVTQLAMSVLYYFGLVRSGYRIDAKPILMLWGIGTASICVGHALGERILLSFTVVPAYLVLSTLLVPEIRTGVLQLPSYCKRLVARTD